MSFSLFSLYVSSSFSLSLSLSLFFPLSLSLSVTDWLTDYPRSRYQNRINIYCEVKSWNKNRLISLLMPNDNKKILHTAYYPIFQATYSVMCFDEIGYFCWILKLFNILYISHYFHSVTKQFFLFVSLHFEGFIHKSERYRKSHEQFGKQFLSLMHMKTGYLFIYSFIYCICLGMMTDHEFHEKVDNLKRLTTPGLLYHENMLCWFILRCFIA